LISISSKQLAPNRLKDSFKKSIIPKNILNRFDERIPIDQKVQEGHEDILYYIDNIWTINSAK
jgi:hypothetical protein